MVCALQEADGFEVLAPAMLVGDPLAFLARVVEVKHGGDRIHPQPVDVIALQPEQGIVQQKAGDLAAAEIVDRRVPVGVIALPRVGMFVKCGAVKARQTVLVGWKMRRHPVENDAKSSGMGGIHKAREIRWRAEARGWRIQPCRLIAP